MPDPTSYLATKVASMIGGLLGGFAILTFIKPKTIWEAFVRGGVSVGSAIVFADAILIIAKIPSNWETQLMSGFCVGFFAYAVLGMIANFLHKHNDLAEAVKDLKGSSKSDK